MIGSNISLSMGIFVVSFAGHASLPQVYREMKKPEEFEHVLDICFSIMFLVYAGSGIIGYLIYGYTVDIIISTNLVEQPGGVLASVTAGFLIAQNYLTINPLMSVLCDSPEIIMGIEEDRFKQRAFRTVIFVMAAYLAYMLIHLLPFLEGLTSAISIMITTFILPSTLFGVLYKDSSSTASKATSIFLSVFGVVMMVFLSYGAIKSLL